MGTPLEDQAKIYDTSRTIDVAKLTTPQMGMRKTNNEYQVIPPRIPNQYIDSHYFEPFGPSDRRFHNSPKTSGYLLITGYAVTFFSIIAVVVLDLKKEENWGRGHWFLIRDRMK